MPSIPFALVLQLLLGGVVVAVLLLTLRHARRARRAQDRLIDQLPPAASGRWFRVMLCRPAFFARWLRLQAFETRGLLVNADDHVRLLAEWPSGERLDRSLRKDALALQWVGNASLPSANLHWIRIGSGAQALLLTADTGLNAMPSREATADLWRQIAPPGALPVAAAHDFALEKHPATMTAMVALFALLLFAGVDGVVLNPFELLEGGLALWGVAAAAGLALPVCVGLLRLRVPGRESLGLAMLLGLAAALAWVPAIKRLDQWLAPEGVQSFAYRLGEDARFTPVEAGPPEIDFSNHRGYWAQYAQGSEHRFDLVHGPLGLWQLDHTPLRDAIRAYYRAHPEARPRRR